MKGSCHRTVNIMYNYSYTFLISCYLQLKP